MIRKWGRIRTSQWHLVHSVRVLESRNDTEEALLTYDGEWLPTERRKHVYEQGRYSITEPQETGAKVIEAERPPRSNRVCSRCLAFVILLDKSVEIE